MDINQFTTGAPGTLRPTINDALAFVPNPLPTNLALGSDTIRLLAQAENAVGRLAGTTSREFNPYLIGSPMLHREAILSSRMEGTVTTPERLVLFEAESKRTQEAVKTDADSHEVVNYISSMRVGLDLLDELPVCLRMIRDIHRTLMSSVRGEREMPGEFRNEQNWIRGRLDDDIHNARFVPPPVNEMTAALKDLEVYLNVEDADAIDPLLIRLALIHYQFETIHPFRDGNGRIGRLLIPLLMVSHERLDAPTLYLSAFFERNRGVYQDLLLTVSQTGNWLAWINFFLRGVYQSATEANDHAIALLKMRQRYHRQFQKGRSSALVIRLIDRLFQTPTITINEAAKLLDVSHQAAAGNIRKLVEKGILVEMTGRQRNQIFLATEILRFMYDTPVIDEDEEA